MLEPPYLSNEIRQALVAEMEVGVVYTCILV